MVGNKRHHLSGKGLECQVGESDLSRSGVKSSDRTRDIMGMNEAQLTQKWRTGPLYKGKAFLVPGHGAKVDNWAQGCHSFTFSKREAGAS